MFGIGLTANPRFATAETVTAFLPLLQDESLDVRLSAIELVRQVAEVNPEKINSQVIAALTTLVHDQEDSVRRESAKVMGRIIASDPVLATPEMVADLTVVLAEETWAYSAELRLVAGSGHLIASQMVQALEPSLSSSDVDKRGNAVAALAEVLVQDPSVASPTMWLELYETLATLDYNSFDGDTDALAQTLAQLSLQAKKVDETLFQRLVDPLNPQARPVAARALYLIALRDRSLGQFIVERLRLLANDRRPVRREWANIVLELTETKDSRYWAAGRCLWSWTPRGQSRSVPAAARRSLCAFCRSSACRRSPCCPDTSPPTTLGAWHSETGSNRFPTPRPGFGRRADYRV